MPICRPPTTMGSPSITRGSADFQGHSITAYDWDLQGTPPLQAMP